MCIFPPPAGKLGGVWVVGCCLKMYQLCRVAVKVNDFLSQDVYHKLTLLFMLS